MNLKPFLLDQWLNHYKFADPPVEFDLASSTGPVWTLRQMLALGSEGEHENFLDTTLVYSDASGSKALRQSLAEMQGVEPSHIQVVTGASEALWILFFLAAQSKANAILPFPGYPPIVEMPPSLGIEARYYHLRRENDYRIDIDEIKKLTDDNTTLILVNSPHNPTGATLSDEELESLHDFAAERGIQFIVDEVYHPIYHTNETRSAARLPKATVLGDFSKAFCLSGLRTGWIVERDPHRMEQYLDARSYFTISNAPASELLATIAVQNRETIFNQVRDVTRASLVLLDKFFDEFKDVLGWIRPQGGMTAFPWLKSDTDSRVFCRTMAERGVLLAPGDCFGMPAHFRFGFGASGTQFPQALERFADSIKNYLD
jgi:aspartate/methionine/tyrosine aminotransferase